MLGWASWRPSAYLSYIQVTDLDNKTVGHEHPRLHCVFIENNNDLNKGEIWPLSERPDLSLVQVFISRPFRG